MTYVYEKGQEQENVSFDVSELEKLYADLLSSNDIIHAIHVSRFAESLNSQNELLRKKLTVVFTDRVDKYGFNQILEPDSFLHSMNKVGVSRNFERLV